ncbi:KilA-N domain-containing protein [Niabella sp. CC-SYL272]|uniref:KilA-N domain-containing protein n=1 Tax=Niabella agricola TaxID=2891571 RepID=UPI001F306009|nr:KilA-N domain-containing protein [Niabella agricola]MCF3107343.1 KilA-N domain-containing protein [Niabella agricola]
MSKIETIVVQGYPIDVEGDYISLTNMVKSKGDDGIPSEVIKNWLNTHNTIDFLAAWESINSNIFKVVGFHHVKENLGNKVLSVKSWVEATDAVGIYAKSGRTGGGTFAHKDIAFEFGAYISPVFKLYLIKEFQRLKEMESRAGDIEWNTRRLLSKAQYVVQTDAVKQYKIPALKIPQNLEFLAYAEEGDILNLAMWGFTAKQWREANVDLAAKGHNVREYASINELMVLSTLEGINASLIKDGISFSSRLVKLKEIAKDQLATLERSKPEYMLRKDELGEFTPFVRNDDKSMFPVRNKLIKKAS